jgi:hypothetical protein
MVRASCVTTHSDCSSDSIHTPKSLKNDHAKRREEKEVKINKEEEDIVKK